MTTCEFDNLSSGFREFVDSTLDHGRRTMSITSGDSN
jgi:hypothetical protein